MGSLLTLFKIGLPAVFGISLLSIPTALNESKPSRSFYEQDDNLNLSPIIDTPPVNTASAKEIKKTEVNEIEVKSSFIDGYKINTSNFLEKHLNTLRSKTINQLNIIDAEVSNVTSAFKNEANTLYSHIYSVYDPRDQFLPSFIYALTTTLTGSILVNRKSLPVRFLSPLVFAAVGFKVFLPRTFDNTINAIKNWEAESYPELLNYQRSFKKFLIDSEEQAKAASKDLNKSLVATVHDIRTSLTTK